MGNGRGRKKWTVQEMKQSDMQQYLDLMNQWLILKHRNIKLDSYLYQHGWQNIAIYGMGIYGRHLARELAGSALCGVVCGIDQKKMEPYENIPVYQPGRIPDTAIGQVQVIVNTVVHDKSVMQMLADMWQQQHPSGVYVLDLETLVFDSYKEKY